MSFEDDFKEIGGLWRTKSGKGLSGKIKLPDGEELRIFVFENHSDNSKHPTHKVFIPKDSQPQQQKPDQPTTLTQQEKDEIPF